MTFSLRTLMLLFPALIIAYGLAWIVAIGIVDRPRSPRPAVWNSYDYNHLFGYMEHYFFRMQGKTPFDWRKLNSYFAGKLPPADREYDLIALAFPQKTDRAGNPYACVPLNDAYEPDENQTTPRRLGFYSVGADGISRSHGNDADDTNSWLFDQPAYQTAWEEKKAWHYRPMAFLLTPLTFVLVRWSWRKKRRRHAWRRPLPHTIDYPESEVPNRNALPRVSKEVKDAV